MELQSDLDALRREMAAIPRKVAFIVTAGVIVGFVLQIIVRIIFGPYAGLSPAPLPLPGNSSGNSVHIGAAPDATPESRKTYLTTDDVAARENLAERTVVKYIHEGRLEPAPVKDGKAYRIAAEYRILPHPAE